MTESSAEAKYQEFERLRNRFGGEQRDKESNLHCKTHVLQHFRRDRECKRRLVGYDPKTNAPPLVPLVEEGDQLHQVIDNRALIKGKWKHSCTLKSDHLNYPDYDALETASSSSAYSSKSESSVLSPPCGSVTELSDGGSCDTFQEYDTPGQRSHQPRPQRFSPTKRTAVEGSTFPPSDCNVSPNFVKDHAYAWDKVIGEWIFEGISPILSPFATHVLRVSNEVRLPTPLWTPQGSTDNLLESESRCSLLSSGEESVSIGGWVPERHARLGKFVHRRSCSTSNLVSAFQSLNLGEINHHMRSLSGTDLLATGAESNYGKEGIASCGLSAERERGGQSARAGIETGQKCKEKKPGTSEKAELTGLKMVSEKLKYLDTDSSTSNNTTALAPAPAQPSVAVEPCKGCGAKSSEDKRTDPEVKSVVKQRALLFGGMKK